MCVYIKTFDLYEWEMILQLPKENIFVIVFGKLIDLVSEEFI